MQLPQLIKIFSALSLAITLNSAVQAQQKKYYVATSGNDDNDGLSVKSAWRSLGKISELNCQPGDTILLEGGSVFKGSIKLTSDDNGSLEKPIVFGSFGNGKAVIDGGDEDGIHAVNASNIKINSLIIKGSGVEKNQGSGIHFYSNDSTVAPAHILINDCDVSGFRTAGIIIGAHENPAVKGYQDVRITHCNASQNGEAGISSYGSHLAFQHHDFYIAWCKAYNNRGILSKTENHSGNGIVMGQIDGLIIEHCEAFDNGADNRCTAGGPVGIWVWMCKNAIIQYCISHDNHAGLTKDGGGFDIDGGAANCILQYNYSYNNEGAGYLLAEYGAIFPFTNNIIRFNISVNDGRKNNYGAISIWGAHQDYRVTNTSVYNNTIYVDDKKLVDGKPAAITLMGPHFSNVILANNIFLTRGNVNVLNGDSAVDKSALLLLHNNYYSYSNQYNFQWGNKNFSSLQAWIAQNAGQERITGKPIFINLNPLLKSDLATAGTQIPDVSLDKNSPLRNKKFRLKDHFTIYSNTEDLYQFKLSDEVMPGASLK